MAFGKIFCAFLITDVHVQSEEVCWMVCSILAFVSLLVFCSILGFIAICTLCDNSSEQQENTNQSKKEEKRWKPVDQRISVAFNNTEETMLLSPYATLEDLQNVCKSWNHEMGQNGIIVQSNLPLSCFQLLNHCTLAAKQNTRLKIDLLLYSLDIPTLIAFVESTSHTVLCDQLMLQAMRLNLDVRNNGWLWLSGTRFHHLARISRDHTAYSFLGRLTQYHSANYIMMKFEKGINFLRHRANEADDDLVIPCKLQRGHMILFMLLRMKTTRISVTLDHYSDITVRSFLQWLSRFPHLQIIQLTPSSNKERDQKILRQLSLYLDISKLSCVLCNGHVPYITKHHCDYITQLGTGIINFAARVAYETKTGRERYGIVTWNKWDETTWT